MVAAHKPEECDLLLLDALQRGDLEAAVALYEPTARIVLESGQLASGRDAIREVMRGFIAAKAEFSIDQVLAFLGPEDNLALTSLIARVRLTEPDGKRVTMKGQSMEVVRRQPDGTWRFIIDNPNAANLTVVPD